MSGFPFCNDVSYPFDKFINQQENDDPATDIHPYICYLNDIRLIKSSLYPHCDQCYEEHL